MDKEDRHLRTYTLEELEETICRDCSVNNMAEYACINHMKDSEAVCIDCCYCHKEEF